MDRDFKDFLSIGSDIVKEFSDPKLKEWDNLAKDIPVLIETLGLRNNVESLPIIDVSDFAHDFGIIKRIYTMITFIAHAYIQGRQDEAKMEVKIIYFSYLFNCNLDHS